jgi:peptidyl-prolyl cis-trans isomerase SurA
VYAVGICLTSRSLSAEIVDRIVAIVNNDVISLYELNQVAKPYFERIKSSRYPLDVEKKLMFEVRQKILKELIDQKLTDQELERLKISVSDREIENTIERLKESQFITDEQLREALAKEGLTYEQYREQTKKQIQRAKLVNLEIRSKVVITEEDIKAYYDSHKAEFAGEKKFHLRNIHVRVPSYASYDDRQNALKTMQSARLELENGKTIETVVLDYSAAGSMLDGGDLGFFKLDDLAPRLQELIKDMKAGDFTPVLEMEFGFQIVYVDEIVESGGKSLEEVETEIQRKLYNQIVDEKYSSWLQTLRDRSHIKIVN